MFNCLYALANGLRHFYKYTRMLTTWQLEQVDRRPSIKVVTIPHTTQRQNSFDLSHSRL